MAFGKRREPTSYGVPVRSSTPELPPPPAPTVPPVPYAPVPPAPMPAGAQFAPVPLQGWAPPPPGYAMPPGYAPAPKSNTARNVVIGLLVTFVGVPILAAIVIPVFLNQRAPLNAPESLAGRARATTPEAREIEADVKDGMSRENGGLKAAVALYGVPGSDPDVMLIAVRSRIDEERDLADAAAQGTPVDVSSRREYDGIVCYNMPNVSTVCLWNSTMSGWVHVYENPSMDEAAAIAQEARRKLG